MKEKRENRLPMSRVHKIVLVCVSVFSLVLLILTLMERAGLRLTNTTLILTGGGLLIVALIVWGLATLVMKLRKTALKISLGVLLFFLVFMGTTLGSYYISSYAALMLPSKYAVVTSPEGKTVVIMRQLDTGMESEEAALAAQERMNARRDFIQSQPDAAPLENADDYPTGAFGYVYRAYPTFAKFFYREKQPGEGEIYLGYESQAKLLYQWNDDGSVRLYLENAEIGDSGEILVP